MAIWLKKDTAVDIKMGPFLDETDGKTIETALSITQADVRLAKNNANWAQKNAAGTASYEEFGWYEVALDATDTNTLGTLIVAVHEAGALPVWREFQVVPGAIYDACIAGTANQTVELSAAAVDAVWDEIIESTYTGRHFLRLLLAAAANVSTGMGTTSAAFRDIANAKNRIAGTVDASGNRTSITFDGT